jgi:hypothetical protein
MHSTMSPLSSTIARRLSRFLICRTEGGRADLPPIAGALNGSAVVSGGDEEPSREAAVVVQLGVPPDLERVPPVVAG